MSELSEILKSKPNVEDYDFQPYSYINALQEYIDSLEKSLTIPVNMNADAPHTNQKPI